MEKSLDTLRKERVIAVVSVGVPRRNERGTDCPLSTLRNDDFLRIGKVGGYAAYNGKLKAAAPGTCLPVRHVARHVIGHFGERLYASIEPVPAFRADTHPYQ